MATYSNAKSVLYKTVSWQTTLVGSPITILTCPPNRIITILEIRLTFDSGFDSGPILSCNVPNSITPVRWAGPRQDFLSNIQNKEDFELNANKLFIMFPNEFIRVTSNPFSDGNQYRLYYLEEGT